MFRLIRLTSPCPGIGKLRNVGARNLSSKDKTRAACLSNLDFNTYTTSSDTSGYRLRRSRLTKQFHPVSAKVSTRTFSSKKTAKETEFSLESQLSSSIEKGQETGKALEGVIIDVKDGFAVATGLSNVKQNQLVHLITDGEVVCDGLVISLEDGSVRIALLSTISRLDLLGSTVKIPDGLESNDNLSILLPEASSETIRIMNPLGCRLDLDGNKSESSSKESREGETIRVFPGAQEKVFVKTRDNIKTQASTGIRLIDILFPIGLGERIAYMGEVGLKKRQFTQKIAASFNENQIDKVIWVSIGQSANRIRQVANSFKTDSSLDRITIVTALHTDPWGLQFLAPYTATSLGEKYMKEGKNVVVIFEGMSQYGDAHAKYAAAQGFPLSTHSQPHVLFLERFTNLMEFGSMTALCIFDTDDSIQSDKMRDTIYGTVDSTVEYDRALHVQRYFPSIDNFTLGRCSAKPFQHKALLELSMKLKEIMFELANLTESMKMASQLGLNLEHERDLSVEVAHIRKLKAYFCKCDVEKRFDLAELIIQLYAISKKALEKVPEDQIEDYLADLVESAKAKRFNEYSGDSAEPISLYEAISKLKSSEAISDYMKLSSEMRDLVENSFDKSNSNK